MAKANEKVVPLVSDQSVVIDDFKSLTGPLTRFGSDGTEYLTVRGRCITQLYTDAFFAAFAYQPEDSGPVADHGSIADLEGSCSPYKPGIDATLVRRERPELAGRKMRHDLVFEILHDSDRDPAKTQELVDALKARAFNDFCRRQAQRLRGDRIGGSQGIAERVRSGAKHIEECDSSWDNAFLTKAAQFVVDYTDILVGDHDHANVAYLKAVLAGKQPSTEKARVTANDIAI